MENLNIYKDTHWSWTFTLYIKLALIIWTTFKFILLKLYLSCILSIYYSGSSFKLWHF